MIEWELTEDFARLTAELLPFAGYFPPDDEAAESETWLYTAGEAAESPEMAFRGLKPYMRLDGGLKPSPACLAASKRGFVSS